MDDDEPDGLPASLEAMWGRPARPTRGPKPALGLERIVAAAIAVADADGLGAVSMSRVAADLGASTMALYRYVRAKDELLVLMVDAASGRPPARPDGDEPWRPGLARWAWGFRAVLGHHPWILRIPITGPPPGPNQTAWLEDGLRSLAGTHLAETEKLSVVLLLSGFVRNEATLAADIGTTAGGDVMPAYARLLRRVADPAGFPALHAALAAGAFDEPDDMDAEFAFGLERMLDGIDALVRRRA